MTLSQEKIAVIGLGYVGLPLAVALSEKFDTIGFDVDQSRIDELHNDVDRTNEIESQRLAQSQLTVTSDPQTCANRDIYIITVPTPIDSQHLPDLSIVEAATRTVSKMIAQGEYPDRSPVVILESTVYPGVTEEICGPLIEAETGLVCGEDFFLAYSPERINPGDREHTIERVTKVVSGQSEAVLDRVSAIYGAITSGGVFKAASIKTAEAAKVIENAQRDINIAFMNEIAQIFGQLGISVWDVLAAARTKWNFLGFSPGLVGGHCIGVDPYYLAHRARQIGHDPAVILAGRDVNDAMPKWIAARLHAARYGRTGSALVLGLTFKEDVPDLRNSKVFEMVQALAMHGHTITVHDPLADPEEALKEYHLKLNPDALDSSYDLVILAVAHESYLAMPPEELRSCVTQGGILADLKGALGSAADWTL